MDDIKNLSEVVSDEMKVGKDESLWVTVLLILLLGTLKDDEKEKGAIYNDNSRNERKTTKCSFGN